MDSPSFERIPIAPGLSYWKAASDPLCADIAVYEGTDCTWIFDVGYGDTALERVRGLPGKKRAVISHFHQDHMGNLGLLELDDVYLGKYTLRHAGRGQVIDNVFCPEPGVKLFPIPSTHAKGCVGMEVRGEFALLGDATYCTAKETQGRLAYNATLLYDTIKTLRTLNASYFLLSHGEPFVREREAVLEELMAIYSHRVQSEAYIFVD